MNLVKVAFMAMVAVALTTAVGTAEAASGKCTVIETKGSRLVLECSQQAGNLQKGDKIKIKSTRSGGAVEGC